MAIIARQFGRPRGLLGKLIGHGMAKGNGEFSRWAVGQIRSTYEGAAGLIAELGPGPGVGLEALLLQFPGARIWGIDLSPVMLSQARRRNLAALESGRLTLIEGGVAALAAAAPADIVLANHVLYFWHEPVAELAQIRGHMRSGALLALGYQLRRGMPPMARKRFPREGHLLYDFDEEVAEVIRAAGFTSVSHRLMGAPKAPEGHLALAAA